MFRYMALTWNVARPEQWETVENLSHRLSRLSSQWCEVLNRSGLRVFCADSQPRSLAPQCLADDAGVVLGVIFERTPTTEDDAPSPKAIFSAFQTASIINSRGRLLTTHYWGNYVAVLYVPNGSTPGINPDSAHVTYVIKDPTGSLPCAITQYRGVTLCFSCLTDCRGLQLPLTLNRSYLQRHLVEGATHQHRPVDEITQLFGGECLRIDPKREPSSLSRQWYWTPLAYPRSDELIEDPDAAARAIRSTVRAATQSLASGHESLLLRLSGGLDSSIINGCLKDAPTTPRVTCYTHFNPRSRSDERPWARLAAQHSGFAHLECAVLPEDIDLKAAMQMPASIHPASVLEFLQRSTMERDLALKYDASGVFNGDGGDSGFCSDSIGYVLSEYLRLHGPHLAALRLASQAALQMHLSTWTVLTRSVRRWATASASSISPKLLLKTCRLAHPELVKSFTPTPHRDHPWFARIENLPGGIKQRLGMLMGATEFYNATSSAADPAADIIAPLYSQPVIELLLRIPLPVHFEAGRDRGLARRAFTPEVPQAILNRLWKDRAPGFHDELIHYNRAFLRELFLDGVLVREKLLDRAAVEKALTAGPTLSDVFPGEILNHMATEIWVRQTRNLVAPFDSLGRYSMHS